MSPGKKGLYLLKGEIMKHGLLLFISIIQANASIPRVIVRRMSTLVRYNYALEEFQRDIKNSSLLTEKEKKYYLLVSQQCQRPDIHALAISKSQSSALTEFLFHVNKVLDERSDKKYNARIVASKVLQSMQRETDQPLNFIDKKELQQLVEKIHTLYW